MMFNDLAGSVAPVKFPFDWNRFDEEEDLKTRSTQKPPHSAKKRKANRAKGKRARAARRRTRQ